METKKNEAQGAQAKEVKAVTAGETSKAVAAKKETPKEQTPKVLTVREQLELQLQQLNRKKELADKREFFLRKKNELLKYKAYVIKDFGQMETRFAKVAFIGHNEHEREEARVNVNNPQFIARYIDVLTADIDKFVAELENELLTGVA
jgi:hypothetical protein